MSFRIITNCLGNGTRESNLPKVLNLRKVLRMFETTLSLMLLLLTGTLNAQQLLNLDFEKRDPANRNLPQGYRVYDSGGKWKVELDDSNPHGGKLSLKIYSTDSRKGACQIGMLLPVEIMRGKKVKFWGWIKTENLKGVAQLDYNIFTQKGVKQDILPSEFWAQGTGRWKRYSVEFSVDSSTSVIGIMVSTMGEGTVWYDDLGLEIDGKPYYKILNRATLVEMSVQPTKQSIGWLKSNVIPFERSPLETSLTDLEPFAKIVGNAKIVGLGEPTHGTKEVFQIKCRLVEFLATKMGFTVFAIESVMPEAYRLNEYILEGKGNPATLIAGMYFWIWRTDEFLAMVKWMRNFNQSGKGKIIFTGFDMQSTNLAIENIRDFITKNEPWWLDSLNLLYPQHCDPVKLFGTKDSVLIAKTYNIRLDEQKAGIVFRHLQQMKETYLKNQPTKEVEWLIQNGRITLNCAKLRSPGIDSYAYRDSCMAENVQWITEQYPHEKIILWGHNEHISRRQVAMGHYLSRIFSKEYLPVGFAFHEGTHTVQDFDSTGRSRGFAVNKAEPSKPGTAEWFFHQAGLSRCILDMRKARPSDPASAWLTKNILLGNIGATKPTNRFLPISSLKNEFDVLIYFDKTTATTIFPSPWGW